MSVVRIVKDKNFITMGKYHLKEKDMSLKAKGLLSQMLSLPDDWDYSIVGLTKINKDGLDSIKATLKELEQFGYLKRTRIKETKGKFIDIEYTIYEKPQVDNPLVGKPPVGNPLQLNTKELNTNLIEKINNKENINNKLFIQKKFIKPSLEEVKEYCKERDNKVDAEYFIDYYESKGWMIGKNKMKDWKACVRTWEKKTAKKKKEDEIDWERLSKELDGDEDN